MHTKLDIPQVESVAHSKKSVKPNKLKVVGNKHTKRPKQENQNWLWLDIPQVESVAHSNKNNIHHSVVSS